MRSYHVLLTDNKGTFLIFRRELERYELPIVDEASVFSRPMTKRFPHEVDASLKGKNLESLNFFVGEGKKYEQDNPSGAAEVNLSV